MGGDPVTPAEHYAKAEALLADIARIQEAVNEDAEHLMSDPDAGHRIKQRAMAIDRLVPLTQVHATLATVDPVAISRTTEVSFYSDRPNCTCPALVANPIARTSTDPDCPIHGQGKD